MNNKSNFANYACLVFIIGYLVLLVAGCGHNLATQSKGWGVDVTWNPDAIMPSLRLGYWDVSYAMVKENAEVKMKSTAQLSGDASNSQTSATSAKGVGEVGNSIELKTGAQTNGYVVDVLTSEKSAKNDKVAKYIYGVKEEK